MSKTKFERTFDAYVWKTGNALVITIPSTMIRKFKIKKGEVIEVTVKR
jgi:antitoxin component of MazEF toxin-antitoxin module